MSDRNRRLHDKYRVERTDGESGRGKKHDGCEYFVLDLTHDLHAVPAIQAYADSCEREYPLLADDLRNKASDIQQKRRCAMDLFNVLSRIGNECSQLIEKGASSEEIYNHVVGITCNEQAKIKRFD